LVVVDVVGGEFALCRIKRKIESSLDAISSSQKTVERKVPNMIVTLSDTAILGVSLLVRIVWGTNIPEQTMALGLGYGVHVLMSHSLSHRVIPDQI